MPPRRPGGKYKGLVKKTKGANELAKEAEEERRKRLQEQAERAEAKRAAENKLKDASLKSAKEQEAEVRKQRILNMLVGGRKGDLKKFFKSWVVGLVAVKRERVLKERERAWRCSCRVCLDGSSAAGAVPGPGMMCTAITQPPFIVQSRVVAQLSLTCLVMSQSPSKDVIEKATNLLKDAAFIGLLRTCLEGGFMTVQSEVEVLGVTLESSDKYVNLAYTVDFQAVLKFDDPGVFPGMPNHWTKRVEGVKKVMCGEAFEKEVKRALEGRPVEIQVQNQQQLALMRPPGQRHAHPPPGQPGQPGRPGQPLPPPRVQTIGKIGVRPALRHLEEAFMEFDAQVQVNEAKVLNPKVMAPAGCSTFEALQDNNHMMPFDIARQKRRNLSFAESLLGGAEEEDKGVLTSIVKGAASLAKSASLPTVGPVWSQKAIPNKPWTKEGAAGWLDDSKAIVASHQATGRRVLLDPVMMRTRFADGHQGWDRSVHHRDHDLDSQLSPDSFSTASPSEFTRRRDRRSTTLTSALSMLMTERSLSGSQTLPAAAMSLTLPGEDDLI